MCQIAGPDGGRAIAKAKIDIDIDILALDVGCDRGFVIIGDAFAVFRQNNATGWRLHRQSRF